MTAILTRHEAVVSMRVEWDPSDAIGDRTGSAQKENTDSRWNCLALLKEGSSFSAHASTIKDQSTKTVGIAGTYVLAEGQDTPRPAAPAPKPAPKPEVAQNNEPRPAPRTIPDSRAAQPRIEPRSAPESQPLQFPFRPLSPAEQRRLMVESLLTRPDAPQPAERLNITLLNTPGTGEPVERAYQLLMLAQQAVDHVKPRGQASLAEQVIIARDGQDFKRYKLGDLFTKVIEEAGKLKPEDFQRKRADLKRHLMSDITPKDANGQPVRGVDGKPVVLKAWGDPDDPKNQKEKEYGALKDNGARAKNGISEKAAQLTQYLDLLEQNKGNERQIATLIAVDAKKQPELAKLIGQYTEQFKENPPANASKMTGEQFATEVKKLVDAEPTAKAWQQAVAAYGRFAAAHPEVAVREQYDLINASLKELENGRAVLVARRFYAAALQRSNNPNDVRAGAQLEREVDKLLEGPKPAEKAVAK